MDQPGPVDYDADSDSTACRGCVWIPPPRTRTPGDPLTRNLPAGARPSGGLAWGALESCRDRQR